MTDELKRLETLLKSINRGGHNRCSICNKVSNEEIQTELGDYQAHMSFTNDPKDPLHFICVECADSIEDQRQDYQYFDEYNEELKGEIL
jgi:hypothetical protein